MSNSEMIGSALTIVALLAAWWWLFFKKKKSITKKFPVEWNTILIQKVNFYRQLPEPEKVRFNKSVQEFLDQIQITGVGLEVDDIDRLLVAASAVIPLFGYPGWHYRNLNEVLLYEGTFNYDYETKKGDERNILGMVGSNSMNRMMILSKPALHHGFEDNLSKHNVGIHEFIHLLDKADGSTDGIPEIFLRQPFLEPWVKMMNQEIEAIKNGESEIPEYGSTNAAEFFSVVGEYFFQQPHLLEENHPELFVMLKRIFNIDHSS